MTFEEEKSEAFIEESKTAICRDFMRNVCSRGNRRCKFKHPTPDELNRLVDCSNISTVYEFCHDYQNVQCQRANCRFIHGTHEEEEAYHNKKILPLRLKYQYDFGVNDSQENGSKNMTDSGGRPICFDFLSRNSCHRGKKCKFYHPEPSSRSIKPSECVGYNDCVKRPRIQVDKDECEAQKEANNIKNGEKLSTFKGLSNENKYLKSRIIDLEKQVSDLSATNEVLLEQNAQFRFMKKGIASVSPPTTYTSTLALSPIATVVANPPQPRPMQFSTNVPTQMINITGNSGGTVEAIHPAPNILAQRAANINQMTAQPVAQISQHQQASFSSAMPNHNPQMTQQIVSFSGPRRVMGAAIANGQCTIQPASMTGHQSNGLVASIGPAMPLAQPPTLVYTATRTTDNGQPIVNTLVSAPGHEMTLVEQQPPQGNQVVSSMPTPMHQAVQHYNSVSIASSAIVQASSHQNAG